MTQATIQDRYQPAILPGVTYRSTPVDFHGAENPNCVHPGRLVVEGDWPKAQPEECDGTYPTQWIADGQILVCTGCGLDCT